MFARGSPATIVFALVLTPALVTAAPGNVPVSPSGDAMVDRTSTSTGEPSRLRRVEERVLQLEHQADEAARAGDLLRASELLLEAERRLPVGNLRARTNRLMKAIAALRDASTARPEPSVPLAQAEAATRALVEDAGALLGEAGPGPDVVEVERAMAELRKAVSGRSRAEQAPAVDRPQAPPRIDVGPTMAELAAQRRRERGLAVGLGASAGGLAISLGVGIGAALVSRPGGPLRDQIEAAAKEAQSPDSTDLCLDAVGRDTLSLLCSRYRAAERVELSMWLTATAMAIATSVLATLFAGRRHQPGRSEERRTTGRRRPPLAVSWRSGLGLRLDF